jgi:hypothetical protein
MTAHMIVSSHNSKAVNPLNLKVRQIRDQVVNLKVRMMAMDKIIPL